MNKYSIENGYFIFTLMPSLRCSLNCPHCYLSKEQRRSSLLLSIYDLENIVKKVDSYYLQKNIKEKTIVCYWYGGEPTEVGQEYFVDAVNCISSCFTLDKGYIVKQVVLSSLVGINPSWFDLFHQYCGGEVQTSFDYLMRGSGYLKHWEKSVLRAKDAGLKISTISVVNKELAKLGAQQILDYLSMLGVKETSFLPFMLNESNSTGAYDRFASDMVAYSDFMIDIAESYISRKKRGLYVPNIGQLQFVIEQSKRAAPFSNVAAQTLFLLPNGDFALPDYVGYKEYLRVFGNAIDLSFEEILNSQERKKYIRKQITKNMNAECINCEHSDKCLMEFWKKNRDGDECFGAKRFVRWVLENKERLEDLWEQDAVLF